MTCPAAGSPHDCASVHETHCDGCAPRLPQAAESGWARPADGRPSSAAAQHRRLARREAGDRLFWAREPMQQLRRPSAADQERAGRAAGRLGIWRPCGQDALCGVGGRPARCWRLGGCEAAWCRAASGCPHAPQRERAQRTAAQRGWGSGDGRTGTVQQRPRLCASLRGRSAAARAQQRAAGSRQHAAAAGGRQRAAGSPVAGARWQRPERAPGGRGCRAGRGCAAGAGAASAAPAPKAQRAPGAAGGRRRLPVCW